MEKMQTKVNFDFNKVKNIETITENLEFFLEILSTKRDELAEENIIGLFENWQNDRKRNLDNEEKIEKINSAYVDAINYLNQVDFDSTHHLFNPFFKVNYDDFNGLICFLEDAQKRGCLSDILLYWCPKRSGDELRYYILVGGFKEPEVYEGLKQESLKLRYKNNQK